MSADWTGTGTGPGTGGGSWLLTYEFVEEEAIDAMEAMEAALRKPLMGENCKAKYKEVEKKTMETNAPAQTPTAHRSAKSASSKKEHQAN